MNADTGFLRHLEENEKLLEREIGLQTEEVTKKQKRTRKVSLHDNRSKAGKKRVAYVKAKPLTKNQRRNLRQKLQNK